MINNDLMGGHRAMIVEKGGLFYGWDGKNWVAVGGSAGYTTGLTALAAGGQTGATALSTGFNNVTTVAAALDSVMLPAAAAGGQVTVKNSGAYTLAIFPNSGEDDTIDALAADLAISLAPGAIVQFNAVSADLWESGADFALTLNAPTTAKGHLVVACADNTTDEIVTITNAAHAQDSIYTIPDSGLAQAYLLASTTAVTVAEANVLSGVTAGTATASKAIVLNAAYSYALTPVMTGSVSMTPIAISYNYLGADTTGDRDAYGMRTTITQTTTNALGSGSRGFLFGMRNDIVMNGFTDLAYGQYAKITMAGTTTSAEAYGVCSAVYLSTYEATITHVAALFGKVTGSGNVVGSGAADVVGVSGLYISYSASNAMATALTAGSHIAIEAAGVCDSGYQVDAGGTLVNGLYVRNTAGTITNVIKVGGTVSFFADFDDAVTCAVATTGAAATTSCAQILVKTPAGNTGYINVYSSTGS